MTTPPAATLFGPTDPVDLERVLPLSARCEALARLIADHEINPSPDRPLDLSLVRRTLEFVAVALKVRERFGR